MIDLTTLSGFAIPETGLLKSFWSTDNFTLAQHDAPAFLLPEAASGMRKSAAARVFSRDVLSSLTPPDGWWGTHNIALGSLETWGYNRNGDGFPRRTLQDRHSTFVKYGICYRNHNHTDPTQRIGVIKAAAYNPDMDRVELICWMSKRASEKEYEQARAGKQHTYSMSAHMPYDVCSVCYNRAVKVAAYCDDLKYHLTRYMPRLKKYAYAINDAPDLVFFDNSIVPRPADRTAWNLRYLWSDARRSKAASAELNEVLSGVELARLEKMAGAEVTRGEVPLAAMLPPARRALLEKLARVEGDLARGFTNPTTYLFGALQHAQLGDAALSDRHLRKLGALQTRTAHYLLTKQACYLPLPEFVAYITGAPLAETREDTLVKQAGACLPTLFRDMIAQVEQLMLPSKIAEDFEAGTECASDLDPANDDEVGELMDHATRMFSVNPRVCEDRAVTVLVKDAAPAQFIDASQLDAPLQVSHEARTLAAVYGLYKLAALRDIISQHEAANFHTHMCAGLNFFAAPR